MSQEQYGSESVEGVCGQGCRSRRSVLAAVGAVGVAAALAGCQTYGTPVSNQPIATGSEPVDGASEPVDGASEPVDGASEPVDGASEPVDGGGDEPAGEVLAALGDIPVGGGIVFADKGVVVTVPREGKVKAFSATCPHAGCAVSEVSGGTINCNCHGSKFKVTDGSVAGGPAPKGLAAVKVKVRGDKVTLA